ncbi:PPH1 [Auxenochlorella protothecoides x Auxenochlorella symbiontica]
MLALHGRVTLRTPPHAPSGWTGRSSSAWVLAQPSTPPSRGRCAHRTRATSVTATDAASETSTPPPLRYGVSLTQGPREEMEDVAQVIPDACCGFLVASVFDGHGGRLAADYLEKNLYNVFNDILKEDTISLTCSVKERDSSGLCCPLELTPLLRSSFKKTDEQLLQYLHDLGDEDALTCGCTATTVLVHPDRLIVANVGDSRAVLSRGGEALVLSTEHRIPEDGSENEETARIRAAGGWVEDERVCGMLAVTRAFGDPEFKGEGLQKLLRRGVEEGFWTQEEADQRHFSADPVTALPDVTALVRTPDDEFLVVASDGLWDVLSSAEVLKAARQGLRKGLSLQAVADTLADRALRRHTYDNVAVVVVDMGGGRQGWKPQAKGLLRGLFSSS